MVDLAEILKSPTVDAIYEHYESQEQKTQKRRPYLGGSILGEECRLMLWFGFRWVGREPFEGRILRLFDTGHREEERVKADLRAIGCIIEGEQYEVSALNGHLKGHFDGVILRLPEAPKTWHLKEVKTGNKSNFNQVEKHGVKKAKPVHHSQMQLYMGLGKLKRAVYIMVCKDDDRIHVERIRFDKTEFEALIRKAASIIYADAPPARVKNDPSFYQCKFCDYDGLCYGKRFTEVNCRTCAHSSPVATGWDCALGHEVGDGAGCGEHIYIPGLVHWLQPVAGDPGWVDYGEFINVAEGGFPASDKPHYSSLQLFQGEMK